MQLQRTLPAAAEASHLLLLPLYTWHSVLIVVNWRLLLLRLPLYRWLGFSDAGVGDSLNPGRPEMVWAFLNDLTSAAACKVTG